MEDHFEKGTAHFDQEEYFEAHEEWEEIWTNETGARRAYLQCLIQVAVGLYHAQRENWAGNRKLFASALGYLEKGRSEAKEVDLDALKDLVLEFELALQKKLAGEEGELPYFKLPRRGNPE